MTNLEQCVQRAKEALANVDKLRILPGIPVKEYLELAAAVVGMTTPCNAVHVFRGSCRLVYGHEDPHAYMKDHARIQELKAQLATAKIEGLETQLAELKLTICPDGSVTDPAALVELCEQLRCEWKQGQAQLATARKLIDRAIKIAIWDTDFQQEADQFLKGTVSTHICRDRVAYHRAIFALERSIAEIDRLAKERCRHCKDSVPLAFTGLRIVHQLGELAIEACYANPEQRRKAELEKELKGLIIAARPSSTG